MQSVEMGPFDIKGAAKPFLLLKKEKTSFFHALPFIIFIGIILGEGNDRTA